MGNLCNISVMELCLVAGLLIHRLLADLVIYGLLHTYWLSIPCVHFPGKRIKCKKLHSNGAIILGDAAHAGEFVACTGRNLLSAYLLL